MKEVPQRACTFCPFQELYTHFYCEIGYFRARFASLLNLSNAQIAVAATDVRSKRYSRDALASSQGPLPCLLQKVCFQKVPL